MSQGVVDVDAECPDGTLDVRTSWQSYTDMYVKKNPTTLIQNNLSKYGGFIKVLKQIHTKHFVIYNIEGKNIESFIVCWRTRSICHSSILQSYMACLKYKFEVQSKNLESTIQSKLKSFIIIFINKPT